jgi:hypothetical protein
VIVFDVNETLTDPESLRPRLEETGAGAGLLTSFVDRAGGGYSRPLEHPDIVISSLTELPDELG